MQEKTSWGAALRIWWAFTWRVVVFGVLVGAAVGFIVGFTGALMGIPQETVQVFLSYASLLVGFPVALAVFRYIIGRRFGRYRLTLIEEAS